MCKTKAAVLVVAFGAGMVFAEEKVRSFTSAKADIGKVPAGWKADQTGQGKVGLWTKADAQAYFDEFKVSGK
jgi:hypothetical protein